MAKLNAALILSPSTLIARAACTLDPSRAKATSISSHGHSALAASVARATGMRPFIHVHPRGISFQLYRGATLLHNGGARQMSGRPSTNVFYASAGK